MARGALITNGVVIDVFEAASGLDLNYQPNAAFVPDDDAQIGDLWDGSVFTYLQSPQEMTALQARRALNAAGLRSTVDAAVAASTQDTKDAWEYSATVQRNNPIINAMAVQLGMSSAQVDSLFRAGVKYA